MKTVESCVVECSDVRASIRYCCCDNPSYLVSDPSLAVCSPICLGKPWSMGIVLRNRWASQPNASTGRRSPKPPARDRFRVCTTSCLFDDDDTRVPSPGPTHPHRNPRAPGPLQALLAVSAVRAVIEVLAMISHEPTQVSSLRPKSFKAGGRCSPYPIHSQDRCLEICVPKEQLRCTLGESRSRSGPNTHNDPCVRPLCPFNAPPCRGRHRADDTLISSRC